MWQTDIYFVLKIIFNEFHITVIALCKKFVHFTYCHVGDFERMVFKYKCPF